VFFSFLAVCFWDRKRGLEPNETSKTAPRAKTNPWWVFVVRGSATTKPTLKKKKKKNVVCVGGLLFSQKGGGDTAPPKKVVAPTGGKKPFPPPEKCENQGSPPPPPPLFGFSKTRRKGLGGVWLEQQKKENPLVGKGTSPTSFFDLAKLAGRPTGKTNNTTNQRGGKKNCLGLGRGGLLVKTHTEQNEPFFLFLVMLTPAGEKPKPPKNLFFFWVGGENEVPTFWVLAPFLQNPTTPPTKETNPTISKKIKKQKTQKKMKDRSQPGREKTRREPPPVPQKRPVRGEPPAVGPPPKRPPFFLETKGYSEQKNTPHLGGWEQAQNPPTPKKKPTPKRNTPKKSGGGHWFFPKPRQGHHRKKVVGGFGVGLGLGFDPPHF